MSNLLLLNDLGMRFPKENSKQKFRYGLYKCFCGNKFETITSGVKRNKTKSCGCNKGNKKHNLANHKLYQTWNDMIRRCNNPKSNRYCDYGGRGIKACDEWKNDFLSFYNWALSNGYQDDLTLDRKENDKGYYPDNCRWVTREIQSRNTRKIYSHNTSGYRGVHWDSQAKKWRTQIIVNAKKIHIGRFNTSIEAAIAYDKYVIDNNLEHTINGVSK